MYEELKYWYLKDHRLFRVLNFRQIRQLCVITGFKKAVKGDILYFSDSDTPRIYFLKKGNIKIVEIDRDGNETIKEILRKGDLFGELTLESDRPFTTEYAQALTDDIIICSFLLSDFENLLLKYPNLALSYTKFMGLKMKRLKNNYTNLVFKDAKSRLSAFLREWCEQEGIYEGNRVTLHNYLTQHDIAQIICTTRQTATQLLNELKEKELLVYNRKEIIIPDISRI
ncbi:Crp/Fnr family transcriptional regulator [Sinomicrobium sp. M5D2P17]